MRKLIFAFPGMGKTPTCRRLNNCMDLDFGMFRTALRVTKANEVSIFPQFIRLIDEYFRQDWKIFTNEPGLLKDSLLYRYVPKKDIIMFLPTGKSIQFCAKKLSVSNEIVMEWVNYWYDIAVSNGIKVIVINVGLDHYLQANATK